MLWVRQCGVQIPAETGEFIFDNISISVLGSMQPSVKCIVGSFPRGIVTGA